MKTRKLGTKGLEVSLIGLGCIGMSEFYGGVDQDEAVATIHLAIDRGVSLIDTADMYGPWTNEQLIGHALVGRRDRAIVASKCGNVRGADGSFLGLNATPQYVRESCDASLRRLGVDHIDLYYLHRVDPNVPIEETVGAMSELVAAGKVRYLGVCEAAPETVQRASGVHPISVLQTEYSLWSRDPEDRILPAAWEMGVGFVAYAPLGRGFLSGRIRRFEDLPEGDFRLSVPRCQGKNFQPNVAVLEQIEEMAAGRQVSPAQLALAWVLAQGVVAIPGTERREFLEQNIAATEIELTEEELASIDTIAPREAIAGDCAGVGFPARSRHPSVCSRPTAAEEFRDGAQ